MSATSEAIYERIARYCEQRMGRDGIGGHHGQEPYKGDFFRIFYDARVAGLCGEAAPHETAINGERITFRLFKEWLPPNDSSAAANMIRTLGEWWDAWAYALDEHPKLAARSV